LEKDREMQEVEVGFIGIVGRDDTSEETRASEKERDVAVGT